MILLDADILLIELRYKNDSRFPVNRQILENVRSGVVRAGVTVQALLEVVGVLSFNVSAARVPRLADLLCGQYRLTTIPDPQQHPGYAGCAIGELVSQMSQQMSLGDAVQAVQIAHNVAEVDCLLSWNARHFQNKIVVPVLTPPDWLARQSPSDP